MNCNKAVTHGVDLTHLPVDRPISQYDFTGKPFVTVQHCLYGIIHGADDGSRQFIDMIADVGDIRFKTLLVMFHIGYQ